MKSLRDRQIQEVLDDDLNINRAVNNLTRNRVQLSEETVAPRKTRDREIEVSIDKLIESVNKITETKTSALDYLLSNITTSNRANLSDPESRRAFETITNNGDFITSYNQLVRLYSQPDLSRVSQDVIRTKFQEIKDNIDALVYGLSEGIQYLFSNRKPTSEIFQLVRSLAVYRFVKEILEQGSYYKPLDQGEIYASIQRLVAEDFTLGQRMALENLRDSSDLREVSLLKLPIEMTQDKARLEALEDEAGFQFPANLKESLNKKEIETLESEYGKIRGDLTAKDPAQMADYKREIKTELPALIKQEQDYARDLRDKDAQVIALQRIVDARKGLQQPPDDLYDYPNEGKPLTETQLRSRFQTDMGQKKFDGQGSIYRTYFRDVLLPILQTRPNMPPKPANVALIKAFNDYKANVKVANMTGPEAQGLRQAVIDAIQTADFSRVKADDADEKHEVEDDDQRDLNLFKQQIVKIQKLLSDNQERQRDIKQRRDKLDQEFEASKQESKEKFGDILKLTTPTTKPVFKTRGLTLSDIQKQTSGLAPQAKLDYTLDLLKKQGDPVVVTEEQKDKFLAGDTKVVLALVNRIIKNSEEEEPEEMSAFTKKDILDLIRGKPLKSQLDTLERLLDEAGGLPLSKVLKKNFLDNKKATLNTIIKKIEEAYEANAGEEEEPEEEEEEDQPVEAEAEEVKQAEEGQLIFPEDPEEFELEEEGPLVAKGRGRRGRRAIRLPMSSPFDFRDGRQNLYGSARVNMNALRRFGQTFK